MKLRCQSALRLFLLVVLVLGGCATCHAPTSPRNREAITIDQDRGDYFVFVYRPGPEWVEGKSVRKQPVLAHATYMAKLEREGKLLMGGPFKDDAGAFGILHCATLEAAKRLIEADPAIRTQLMVAEVHPWFPAVSGCLEARPW